MPSNPASLLERELDVCDETSLRLLLKNICSEIPAARNLALELLALDEDEDDNDDEEEEDGEVEVMDEIPPLEGESRKRKAGEISGDDGRPPGLGGTWRDGFRELGAHRREVEVDLVRGTGYGVLQDTTGVEQRFGQGLQPARLQGTLVVLSDSETDPEDEDADESGDENSNEDMEYDCKYCGKAYREEDNGYDACCSHDEGKYISGDCPLSKEEQELLEDDSEWHVWACCGEPADQPGCRAHAHIPNRGMGY